jgi:hypothetical protein
MKRSGLAVVAALICLVAPASAAAAWQTPVLVSSVPSRWGGWAMLPEVQVAPDGTTTVFDNNQINSASQVEENTLPFGAISAGPATTLAGNSQFGRLSVYGDTYLTQDAAGDTSALWAAPTSSVLATRPAGGSGWSTSTVPLPAGSTALQMAEAPDGTLAILFITCTAAPVCNMGVAVLAAGGGAWRSHVYTTPLCNNLAGAGNVAIGSDDAVVAAWSAHDGSPGAGCSLSATPYSMSLDPGSTTWTEATLPNPGIGDLGGVSTVVDSHGNAVAVYGVATSYPTVGPYTETQELIETGRPSSGSWSAATVIAGTPGSTISGTANEFYFSYNSLLIDSHDNLTLAYEAFDSAYPGDEVVTARKPAGASWSAADQLVTSASNVWLLPLAGDPSGVSMIGYLASNGGGGYDFQVATSNTSGVWGALSTAFSLNNQGLGGLSIAVSPTFGPVVAYDLSDLNGTTPIDSYTYLTWDPLQPPPTFSAPPTITGTPPVQGQALTEQHGTWSSPPLAYAYQWQQCSASGASCTSIAGATTQTYLPTPGDVGHTLRVQEWATANGNTGGPATSAVTAAVQAPLQAPVNTSPPTIGGTAGEGQALTESHGSWTNGPTSYSYQWQRCNSYGFLCGDIAGATGSSYTATVYDVGSALVVEEWATNNAGQGGPAVSAATQAVLPPPPVNQTPPAIYGATQLGQGLSASGDTWTNNPTAYAYQWEDCDSSGGACTPIAGSNSDTYTLGAGDVGHTIRTQEWASNAGGTSSPATSAATALVAGFRSGGSPPANLTAPTINGRPAVGQPLGSSAGTWSGTSPLSFSISGSAARRAAPTSPAPPPRCTSRSVPTRANCCGWR